MTPLTWSRAALLLLLSACTPLGLWIYEDPVVTVSGIILKQGGSSSPASSPVIVALAVKNGNDYVLSTRRLELSLRLDGVPIGSLARDSTVALDMETISTVAVALPLKSRAISARLEKLVTGTHMFAVRGRATFRTPIGTRRVNFAHEGEMVFRPRVGDSLP